MGEFGLKGLFERVKKNDEIVMELYFSPFQSCRILHKTTDFKKGYAIQVGSLYIYHSQLKSLLCPSISCNGMVPCKLAEAHGNGRSLHVLLIRLLYHIYNTFLCFLFCFSWNSEIPWHKSDEQPSVPVKTKIVITSLSRQPNKQKIAQRKRKMGEKEEEYW